LELTDSLNYLADLEYKLLKFGLTPLQARIYLWLLFLGPSNASSLVKRLNIHRADVYRVLRSLVSKGIVEINVGNPMVYIAIVPSKSMPMLMREQERKLSELQTLSDEFIKSVDKRISELRKSFDTSHAGTVLHSSFRLKFGAQVLEMWKEMLRGASEEVMRVWSKFGITYHHEEGLMDDYKNCATKGVKIRAITDIDEDTIKIVKKYCDFIEFRHMSIGVSALRYIIVDRKQVFVSTTLVPIKTSEFTALWTDNSALVRGFIMDFQEAWEKSKPLSLRSALLARRRSKYGKSEM
jgi:sugar-specific transcriptional regulator TrmB